MIPLRDACSRSSWNKILHTMDTRTFAGVILLDSVSTFLSSLENSSSNFGWAEIICGACGIQHVWPHKVSRKLEKEVNFWVHWNLVACCSSRNLCCGSNKFEFTVLHSFVCECRCFCMLVSRTPTHTNCDCCDYFGENVIKIDFISVIVGMSISNAQKLIICSCYFNLRQSQSMQSLCSSNSFIRHNNTKISIDETQTGMRR